SYLDFGVPADRQFDGVRTYVAEVVGQLHTLTGFATFAPLRILFDHPVTVDGGENPRGILLLEYDDLAAAPPPITAAAHAPETSIEVQPLLPLNPKTTYALVVTTQLTDSAGNHIRPSPTFAALLAGDGLSPDLAALRARLQPVVDFMQSAFAIKPEGLALI